MVAWESRDRASAPGSTPDPSLVRSGGSLPLSFLLGFQKESVTGPSPDSDLCVSDSLWPNGL